jgi:probable F420-dependent oxidoreductase
VRATDGNRTEERAALRRRLGSIGAWTFAFDELPPDRQRVAVAEIEAIGFPTLWFPEGSGSEDAFSRARRLLEASERLTIATGIANMTVRDAAAMAEGADVLSAAHPGKFVLGVGVGHGYSTEARGLTWDRPRSRMREYLLGMTKAAASRTGAGRPPPWILAALGPRMLELAAERTAGAHTYFVPVEHTAFARERLGPEPVLAVEQTIVLDPDAERARRVARGFSVDYLELPNYADNLRRLGFTDTDVSTSGSDRLIDATIAWGSVDTVAARVREHLAAGADHVCLQVIDEDPGDVCVAQLRELAFALLA